MDFEGINEVMLFPYSEDMLNIIRFKELLEFNIHSVVSFKSWGYIGRDAATIDGGEASGHIVTSDFEGELDKVDTVVLGSFRKYYGDEGIVEKYLEKILKTEKNVILLDIFHEINISYFKDKFTKKRKKFVFSKSKNFDLEMLNQIKVPVLGVFGMEEDCGKNEMQLIVASALKKKGYKVSMIGSNSQIELLGGNIYPELLYQDDIGEIKKIKAVRSFANNIVESEKPDILIISSPYGINSFGNDQIDYRYNGILSHIITEAIHQDANIFCLNGGRDIRWNKRSIETLELLSCAPIISISVKRLNKRPELASTSLNIKLKKGLFSNEIFSELKRNWEKDLNNKIIDQDYVTDKEIVDLIESTFDVNNRLIKII